MLVEKVVSPVLNVHPPVTVSAWLSMATWLPILILASPETGSETMNSSVDVVPGPNSITDTADTAGDESDSLTVIDAPPAPP